MRKHGWQPPYHPRQVVAVTVFLALGFAFYVLFAPFVGKKKMHQYIVMGVYTPIITCVFGLYIWCAAADPADARVFKSRKYCKTRESETNDGSKHGEESLSNDDDKSKTEKATPSMSDVLGLIPCAITRHCSSPEHESDEHQANEDGMLYCSLCEVELRLTFEVFKYSTHYRACDKCVDGFDHHCKWLNNCIGKRNYKKFFMLMVSAIVLFIVQWSTGIIILIRCAIEHKRFTSEIASKLGNRFTLACYVVVMAGCMILAMIAMLLVGVLFYFHVLLIKKGISTYDYIIALREQDREKEEQEHPQSPQMSLAASTFGQGVVEDQDDVVPPESNSVGKRTVKISPWALARLNAEDVSRAAAEARKKSKILHPVSRKMGSNKLERDSSSDIHPRMASSGAGDAPVSDPLTEIDG